MISFEQYSKEELVDIVKKLVRDQIISEEDLGLQESEDEKNAATLLHAYLCNKDHNNGECTFYTDERNSWVEKVRDICYSMNVIPKQIIEKMNKVREVSNDNLSVLLLLSFGLTMEGYEDIAKKLIE